MAITAAPSGSSSRRSLPTPASLGLTGKTASQDLERLSWNAKNSLEVLWTLAGSGDPNQALNSLVRLADALGEEWEALNSALHREESLRVRLLALIGGSRALADHLIAHPQLWKELAQPLPTAEEMSQIMYRSVGATAVTVKCAGASEVQLYRSELSGSAAKDALTITYRTLIMRLAACDLAGTFAARRGYGASQPRIDFDEIAALLTAAADAALSAAFAVAVRSVYGEEAPDARIAVLTLGKCGARELNYISDVDVVFVAEPVTPLITRVASEFMGLGTACFFQIDANLRPEGKSGALVRTVDSYRSYYRRWAKSWEFQAQLKARFMTGDQELAQEYLDMLAPMVWAVSQREDFVDDVQAMRLRVIQNVPPKKKTRELKLGRGGLRDVEFAVQLLQLVHGRSDQALRVAGTTDALRALVDGGYVGRSDGHTLIEAYEFLRLLEHRLQLQRMRRTHELPSPEQEGVWKWLARTVGYVSTSQSTDTQQLTSRLRQVRSAVADLHQKLFYRPLLKSVVKMSVDELTLSKKAATEQLAALGYRHPERAFQHLQALAGGNSRKEKLQAILLPVLMDMLSRHADPDAGLLNYRKLSEAAFDRTWFLRTLRDEGVVAQRLMFILATSPYAAELIISAPDSVKLLSDGATGPKFMDVAPDQVNRSLVASSKRHEDPDRAVSVARSLRRVELARIASADLLGYMDVARVCMELSLVWDSVLEAALRAEVRHSLKQKGWQHPPARLAVIGMGRLGGAELGYGSDADVMFVAEPVETQFSDAEALVWAASVVDDMRARLSKPSDDPPLEVDLGLRPEGRSGPVVRTIASYERYYQEWGAVWEKHALQRATCVAGDQEVGERFLRMIDQFRYPTGGASMADVREVRRIKARIDNERLPRGADRATHTKLGRGGLTDVEWTVQLLTMQYAHTIPGLHNTSTLQCLDALERYNDPSIISAEQVATLREAWITATKARNALVLVRGRRTDQLPQPGPYLTQTAAAAGYQPHESAKFLEDYLRVTRRAHAVVEEIFWGETPTREYD